MAPGQATVRLEISGVSRAFPGVRALDDVSLRLAPGEIHALVGENGAGKSTLIRLITGMLAPDQGQILLDGLPLPTLDPPAIRRRGVVAVFQEAEFFPDLSIAENMVLASGYPLGRWGGIDWRAVDRRAAALIEACGERWEVRDPGARLSVAQRQLMQIAAALHDDARLLILDEPTSALSARESAWLFAQVRRLQRQGAAILYVSHRQDEIFALADQITVLRDGLQVWSGPTRDIDRAGLVQQMVGREHQLDERLPRMPADTQLCRERLRVEQLCDGAGRFGPVDLSVEAGQIVGLYGLIGAGRTEFAQALCGLRAIASGQITVDGARRSFDSPRDAIAAGLAYLPEDRLRDGVFAGRSVRENAVAATLDKWTRGRWWSSRWRETAAATSVIERLDVRCRSADDLVGQLSGGNQQKTVLGRWLLADPAVLCLDEPTRGIDVAAKQEIHRRLAELADEGRAILLVSSDLTEILACADRVYVMNAGRLFGPYDPCQTTPGELAAAALPHESTRESPTSTSQPAPNPTVAAVPSDAGSEAATTSHNAANATRAAAPSQVESHESRPQGWRWSLPQELGLGLVVALLGAWLMATSPGFSWGAILSSSSVWILLGLAAATTILAGGIDISLGSLLALAAACSAHILRLDLAPWIAFPLAMAVAVLVGAAGGLLNATLALTGRMHPIVVTLGTMTINRGLVLTLLGRKALTGLPSWLGRLVYDPTWQVRGIVVMAAAVALLMAFWLGHRPSGRRLIAWGSSPAAARLAGISQRRVWWTAFGLGGALAGLAGVVQLAQSGQMQAQLGAGWELTAIAVAVVGGVSIAGGRGSVAGVVLGAILLRLVNSALVRWGVADDRTDLFVGLLLLAAVLVDLAWRRRSNAGPIDA